MHVEGGSNGVPVCMCQYHVVQRADGSIMGSHITDMGRSEVKRNKYGQTAEKNSHGQTNYIFNLSDRKYA